MGLDIDPTPGDPVLVLAGGRDYLDVASAIDDAASSLDRLSVDGTAAEASRSGVDFGWGQDFEPYNAVGDKHHFYYPAGS
ncbi:hypothetical protein [Luteimicrobium subarcticum]|uniref:Uncharacterized protein n=1 Tax=Luteimicrobium subarcticum TaxID=620910 RepID=A0A2M8WRJ4_9MICO|nr:hypothetical protein [Luteimicrobium subarcticum]PJI93552.1 hypothetical protein CLV34_2127 [Luteimicrobium subarcticum]